jgi:hypothetical protein
VQEVSRGNLIMGSGFQFDMVPIVDALNAVTSAPVHAKDATSELRGRADATSEDISDGDGEGRPEGCESEGRSRGGSASEGHSGSDGESRRTSDSASGGDAVARRRGRVATRVRARAMREALAAAALAGGGPAAAGACKHV